MLTGRYKVAVVFKCDVPKKEPEMVFKGSEPVKKSSIPPVSCSTCVGRFKEDFEEPCKGCESGNKYKAKSSAVSYSC